MHRCLAIAAVAAVPCALAHIASAETIYAQLPSPGAGAISLAAPTSGFPFANRRRADNFAVANPVEIQAITFWGGDESNDPSVPLSNINGFNLEIYDGSAGSPGSVLYTMSFSKNDFDITSAGINVGLLNAPMFRFDLALPASIDLAAGDYFFSVGATLNNPVSFTTEAFQWAGSLPGDGIFFSDSFDGNGYQPLPGASRTNYAFEFTGVVIPTPATIPALAMAGLFAARRRRA
ncbi:MAG: hypothetical protein EA378_00320 [Phycisphaerales bacterium]|nr:MAG: hypothetical protein EA378_00320 [Phycisphaerales bacterium]